MKLPEGYWLTHIHWVYEAEKEGRGEWVRASLSELPPETAAAVAAEISSISEAYGAERAPRLWRKVD